MWPELRQQYATGTVREESLLNFKYTYCANFFPSTVVHRHIAPFARVVVITSQLTHEVFQSKAALQKYSMFTILARNHVIWTQCRSGADGNSLLARRDLKDVNMAE